MCFSIFMSPLVLVMMKFGVWESSFWGMSARLLSKGGLIEFGGHKGFRTFTRGQCSYMCYSVWSKFQLASVWALNLNPKPAHIDTGIRDGALSQEQEHSCTKLFPQPMPKPIPNGKGGAVIMGHGGGKSERLATFHQYMFREQVLRKPQPLKGRYGGLKKDSNHSPLQPEVGCVKMPETVSVTYRKVHTFYQGASAEYRSLDSSANNL